MDKKTSPVKQDERVGKYVHEFQEWKNDLRRYWPEIDKHADMYEFYKSEESETSSQVTLNTPFAIVESQVAKMNETTLTVTVDVKGIDGMDDFEDYVSSVLHDAIEDPDVAQIHGTFRKVKEMYNRDFLSKGNAVAEIQYCYRTAVEDGKKKIVADNPYTTVLNYKSYIFDPAFQFDNSPVQYLEKFVDFNYLKEQEYKEETDKKGNVITRKGLYSHLDELKELMADTKEHDHDEQSFIVGDSKVRRRVKPIRLLERWEGAKLTVIAGDCMIIREEYDPKKIGWSGILTSMNYKMEGRPYAYGEIAPIYKSVRAQDTIVNQSIEMVNKYLRPSILVGDLDADIDAIIEVMEAGGVTYGDSKNITAIPTNTPPQAAFQTIDSLQQSIERTARYSVYATGGTSDTTDKTQGTATGIQALQTAAEPNFQVKIDAIEESFCQPLARAYLKMIARLMGEDEVRYGLLRNKGQRWVMATKGFLMGQPTVSDMITVGMIKPEEVSSLLAELGIEITPTMGEDALMKTVVFDIDWVVDARLDNKSAADRIAEAQQELALIQYAQQSGVQFSPERVFLHEARKQGYEDIEELLLTEDEKQQMQQEQMQAQQQEMQMQQQQEAQAAQREMQMKQLEIDANLRQEAMRANAQMTRGAYAA